MTGEAKGRSSSRGRAYRETGSGGLGTSVRDRSSSNKARRRREPRTATATATDTDAEGKNASGTGTGTGTSPRSRSGRSLTPNTRKNRVKSEDTTTSISTSAGIFGDLPLTGDDETVSKKLKKQRSDGALDDSKRRARERRKKLDKTSSGSSTRGRAKSPKPGRTKSLDDVSLSPSDNNLLTTTKKKKSALSKISKLFRGGNDSTSTIGTLGDDDDEDKSSRGANINKNRKEKKGKVRSSSAGPLSRRRRPGNEIEDNLSSDPLYVNKTKDEIAKENQDLISQLDREQLRNRRLKKKLHELRKEVLENEDGGDGKTASTALTESTDSLLGPANDDLKFERLERERREMKIQLQEKEKRIAELKKLLDGDTEFGNNSIGSIGSIDSVRSNNDAIWHRLQVLLNQTRQELAEKEELLKAQTANLVLQTDRVAELEKELVDRQTSSMQKWKDDYNRLQEEKKELEQTLQTERKENEDRIQKRDEALVYFRNELFKLKQESKRNLLMDSQHSVPSTPVKPPDSPGTLSATKSVRSALDGISSLVSPSLWQKEKVKTVPPTRSMEWS